MRTCLFSTFPANSPTLDEQGRERGPHAHLDNAVVVSRCQQIGQNPLHTVDRCTCRHYSGRQLHQHRVHTEITLTHAPHSGSRQPLPSLHRLYCQIERRPRPVSFPSKERVYPDKSVNNTYWIPFALPAAHTCAPSALNASVLHDFFDGLTENFSS